MVTEKATPATPSVAPASVVRIARAPSTCVARRKATDRIQSVPSSPSSHGSR